MNILNWNGWLPAEAKTCRDMAALGHSAGDISNHLPGRSRASVIGYCYRHNIPLGHRARTERVRKPVLKIVSRTPQEPPPAVPRSNNSTWKPTSCQWLHDDARFRMFCQNPADFKSYCHHHATKVYIGYKHEKDC